jgi:hypothetical protein
MAISTDQVLVESVNARDPQQEPPIRYHILRTNPIGVGVRRPV